MKYFVLKAFNDLSLNELYDILKLRNQVFIVDQNCPYLDIDDLDKISYHLLLINDDSLVAYLRIYESDKYENFIQLGRVITAVRNKGYGLEILNKGILEGKRLFGNRGFVIEAQYYAKKFYEKALFKQVSSIFLEDGIEHIIMKREE